MMTDDSELARAAADGDAAAFAAILERHYAGLFGLCFRLTGARPEAEDLCQDICLALPGKISSYAGQAKLTTWLYRVAVNAAHDRRRKQARHAKARDGWGDWEANRRAADAETATQIDWLHQAMGALPETLRDTLALTLDDITHAEAAEILGVSEGTVSWRISQARKALRAMRTAEDAP